MIRDDHFTFKTSAAPEDIRPLEDRMLVKPDGKVKSGLIHIPEAHRPRPQTGTIVAIGRGYFNKRGVFIPTELKVGDHIAFGKLAGDPVRVVNGQELLTMCEGDVLGVLEQ